jgi:hypothetical protein
VQAIEKDTSTVIGVHGILAKVVQEVVAMKDGTHRPLITITIADGPPKAFIKIQFWNASKGTGDELENQLHQAVNVTKVRVKADPERGNTYESIGSHSRVTSAKNPTLETWFFTP